MNTLKEVRTNIFYSKEGENMFKMNEMIFVLDKPSYRMSNEGHVIRERSLEEFRFVIDSDNFGKFIELLQGIKSADESEIV